MATGNYTDTPRKYYSISKENNKIRHKTRDSVEEFSDWIEGYLTNVEVRESEYEGQTIAKVVFTFSGKDGSEDILQTGESSIFTRMALNRLASIEGPIGLVRMAAYIWEYEGKKLTCCSLQHRGQKMPLKFKSRSQGGEIPDQIIQMVGKKEVKDDTDRVEFFRELIVRLQSQLPSQSATALGIGADAEVAMSDEKDLDDDLPF